MPTADDLTHHYDPNCGCDGCYDDDPRPGWFEGLFAEVLADDPRDAQALYEGLTPAGSVRTTRSAT